jgi:hypothetical protein
MEQEAQQHDDSNGTGTGTGTGAGGDTGQNGQGASQQGDADQVAQLAAELEKAQGLLGQYEERIGKMDAKIGELLDEKKTEQQKRREAADEAARKAGDIEALDKSWREKFEAREAELGAQVQERDGWIRQSVRDTVAERLANSLAIEGSAELLLPQIRDRLGVEIRDGKPTTVVLDEDGKPSAKTIEELGKEIAARAANAPIIVASKSTGGGAKGGRGPGGAGSRPSEPSKMTTDQKSAYIKENGLAAWNQLVANSQ